MKHKIILIGLLFLVFTSCKKSKVEIPESNDPVFKASGLFGSNNFSIVAGDDDVFMHTMTDIVNGVEVISGKIANNDFGIEIGIFNGFIDQPNHQFESDFNIYPTYAKENLQPLVVLHKSNFSNAAEIQTINWTIGNDYFQGSAPIYEAGKYMVCAEIIYLNNTVKNLCNELIIGYNREETGKITSTYNDITNELKAYIEPINSSIESIQWFIDDVYISNSDTLISTVTQNSHEIKVKIQYSNGVYREKAMIKNTYDDSQTIEDFTFFENIPAGFIAQDYNVRIKVYQNGTTYESMKANNSNSSIVITGLSYYGKNPDGFDVYKINATINCKVKENGGTTEIPLVFSTVFGIEIKS